MTTLEMHEFFNRLIDIDGGSVDSETGEIFSREEIDNLEMVLDEKIENCLLFYKNEDAMVEAIKGEETKLADRRKKHEKKRDWMKQYVADILAGGKFETARVKVAWRKGESVNIADNAEIPDEYIKVEVTRKPDKTAIKKVLKEGMEIKGCTLITSNNMSIK